MVVTSLTESTSITPMSQKLDKKTGYQTTVQPR